MPYCETALSALGPAAASSGVGGAYWCTQSVEHSNELVSGAGHDVQQTEEVLLQNVCAVSQHKLCGVSTHRGASESIQGQPLALVVHRLNQNLREWRYWVHEDTILIM